MKRDDSGVPLFQETSILSLSSTLLCTSFETWFWLCWSSFSPASSMTWITPFSSTPNSYLVSCHVAVAGPHNRLTQRQPSGTVWHEVLQRTAAPLTHYGASPPGWKQFRTLSLKVEVRKFVLGISRLTTVTGRRSTGGTVGCWHASKSSRISPRFFMSSEPAIMLLLAHINAANNGETWRNL